MSRPPPNLVDLAKNYVAELREYQQKQETQVNFQDKFLASWIYSFFIESPMAFYLVPHFLHRASVVKDNPYLNSVGKTTLLDRTKMVKELDCSHPAGFYRGYELGPGIVVRSVVSANVKR